MLRITGGKVYDPANGIDGEVKDLFIDDGGRFVAASSGRRPDDRRHGDDRLSRRRRCAHARGRRRDQLRPRDDAGRSSPHAGVHSHQDAAQRPGRHGAHDLRHRLSLRRHGLHDGERSGRAGALGPPHARRAGRHSDRRQVLADADGEQRDHARPAGEGRVRAGEASRGVVPVGGEVVRHQGRQSGRRGGVEMGQRRQAAHSPIEGYST